LAKVVDATSSDGFLVVLAFMAMYRGQLTLISYGGAVRRRLRDARVALVLLYKNCVVGLDAICAHDMPSHRLAVPLRQTLTTANVHTAVTVIERTNALKVRSHRGATKLNWLVQFSSVTAM